MSDFYEDLANEAAESDSGSEISEKEFRAMLRNKIYTLPRPYVTENDLVNRAVNIYQGPSHHDVMDRLRQDFRKPVLVLNWKVLLLIGSVLVTGAVLALVA